MVSLLIDAAGSASYLLPVVGEGLDIAWAPIQTILIAAMYDPVSPNLKFVSFVEEILPSTDIVPSPVVGWLMEFGLPFVLGKEEEEKEGASIRRIVKKSIRQQPEMNHPQATASAAR